jgi:hypothetical protein
MANGLMVRHQAIQRSVFEQAREIFNVNGQVSTKFDEVFESSKRIGQ